MQYQLRISGKQSEQLYSHLFPGDGKEAVAIALCGSHFGTNKVIVTVHEVFEVPHEKCDRSPDYVHWKTEDILPALEKASKKEFSILKVHSHPTGFPRFSELDDQSDLKLLPSLYGWTEGDQPHGSIVMLPDKRFFGRVISMENDFIPFDKISVAGETIEIWNKSEDDFDREVGKRNLQTFGEGTTKLLKNMKVGVVGASGTGSPTIEQLVRLGVGEIVIVDPDKIEKKNLNRILNSTLKDANDGVSKVDALSKVIEQIGFGTKVITFKENLYSSKSAIRELIDCDVLFGCLDSIDGRHLLNQITTFYIIPYFDMGVKLEADSDGGINQVNGAVHYIQPSGSSLLSRGVYSAKGLEAAALLRQDPEEYGRRAKEKYIVNLPVESPAVISINMQVSSFAVNEFLDRIHPFKGTSPDERAINWISISEGLIFSEPDGESDEYLAKRVGRGDIRPFLEMPEL